MRFSLRQLLIGVAIVSTVLVVYVYVSTANRVGIFNQAFNHVTYLTYSPDGTTLALTHYRARDAGVPFKGYVADVADSVELLDTATLLKRTVVDYKFYPGNRGPFFRRKGSIEITPDGRYLQVCGRIGGPIRAWDIDSSRWSNNSVGTEPDVYNFMHSPDGRWFATCGRPNGTRVLDTESGGELPLKTRDGWLFGFSPDSKLLAFATRDGVQVWNLGEKRLICSFHEHYDSLDSVTCLAISPDDDTLAMRCQEGLRLFSIKTGNEQFLLPEDFVITRRSDGCYGTESSGHSTRGVAFSPDGKLLVAWGSYGINFYDMSQGGKLVKCLDSRPDPSKNSGFGPLRNQICCLAFAPDGKTYATGDWDGKVTICDTSTCKEIRSIVLRSNARIP